MSLAAHPAAELFPLLGEAELRELADDIRANGLRYAITLDTSYRILDGRNRYRACQIAGIEPRTTLYEGDDPVAFVVSMNLRRRHLNETQRSLLANRLANLPSWRPPKESAPIGALSQPHAANLMQVSRRSVQRAAQVEREAPDLVSAMESGELALGRAERIIRDREAEQRRVTQAREDAANLPDKPRVDLRHGDFREVLADVNGVDAVITDPPYPREFLPLLADLAAWADKALTEDGILAVLFGQTYLPEVYRLLEGHRPYRWTMAYLTPGPSYASHVARVHSNWKPVLVYGGGPRFADIISAEGGDANAKNLHHWGQDYGAFHTIIERLTRTGQTVADPFMGSGTTLLAAHALGRHVIGADIDEQHVHTARQRLT